MSEIPGLIRRSVLDAPPAPRTQVGVAAALVADFVAAGHVAESFEFSDVDSARRFGSRLHGYLGYQRQIPVRVRMQGQMVYLVLREAEEAES